MAVPNPDESDNIWIAASDDRQSAVEAYLSSGVDVNAQDDMGYSPLMAAVSYGYEGLTAFLLAKGANPNIRDGDNDTPLHQAETVAVAEILLAHGADINAVNDGGQTAHEVAGEDDRYEVQNYLRAKLGLPPVEPELEDDELLAQQMQEENYGMDDGDVQWEDVDDEQEEAGEEGQ